MHNPRQPGLFLENLSHDHSPQNIPRYRRGLPCSTYTYARKQGGRGGVLSPTADADEESEVA